MSKKFHQSNVKEGSMSTYDEDDDNLMDAEVNALKAQPKPCETICSKVLRNKSQTMLVVLSMFIIMLELARYLEI